MAGKRMVLCVLAGLALVCTAAAQQNDSVRVDLFPPPNNQLTRDDLWHARLTNNMAGPVTVYLRGYLVKGEDIVLSGYSSNSITLAHGSRALSAQDITGIRDLHYMKGYEGLTVRGGTAPEGEYSSCLEVYETGTNRKLGSKCIDVKVTLPGAPRLISPRDGAALPEGQRNPVFSWTRPMPLPSGAVSYGIRIVEVLNGQSNEQAVRDNPALFEQTDIGTTTLAYPTSARTLEKGKKYAWQVIASFSDGKAPASEIRAFVIAAVVPKRWCNEPHPDFCPYNRFTNGDFEDISGDPAPQTSADINLANGWGAIWTSNLGTTLADLWCPNQAVSGLPPVYPNGSGSGVYAGCWIDNRLVSSNGFREGMFNLLSTPIDIPLMKQYTFTFDMAPVYTTDATKSAEIGVYAIYNPSNQPCAEPTGNYSPPNAGPNSLFGPGNTALIAEFTVTGPVSNQMTSHSVQFDQSQFTTFTASQITHIMITHTDDTTFGMWYVAFDNFCMCKTESIGAESSKYCCPGPNLVHNGSFESSDTGFTSGYGTNHWPAPNGGQVGLAPEVAVRVPGNYVVIDSATAMKACDQWAVQDHSICNNGGGGHFMAVNGKTQQTNANGTVIWQQTVTTIADSNYIFCTNFKWLHQCCFDIQPQIKITISPPGTPVEDWTAIGNPDVPPDRCDWQLIQQNFKATGTSVTIKIILAEDGSGDGNDLAIDDISVQKLPQAPVASTNCTWSFSYPSGDPDHFNLTFTPPDPPLPNGFSDPWPCGYYWSVSKLDNQGNPISGSDPANPQAWWVYPTPMTFPGYKGTSTLGDITKPGLFDKNTLYRITYGVWCKCLTWNQSSWDVIWHPGKGSEGPTVTPNRKYKPSAKEIKEMMNESEGQIRR
jgi:hypothetical protein